MLNTLMLYYTPYTTTSPEAIIVSVDDIMVIHVNGHWRINFMVM